MDKDRLQGDFDKRIILLKGVRNVESYVKDIEDGMLYFTNAEVFRKMGREDKENTFGDSLDGYYIRPFKEKNNFLNIRKKQVDGFDRSYLAKIYNWMKEVYICSFFYITVEEFVNNSIPESIINTFENEFSNRKIAVFHGVQDLLDGFKEEQGTEGWSWANYVHYQGVDEPPIFEESEYDEDPRLGYLLKRKNGYESQREFRICYHSSSFTDSYLKANKNGFNLSFGNIGTEGRSSVTILDDIHSLRNISIESID